MESDYEITAVDQPAWSVIGGGISQYNEEQAGKDDPKWVCFVVKGPNEDVVGGIIGATFYEWLHVDLMWVRDDLRGQGYGRRLLALAEEEARQRGARHAYLDTFSFQAPGFYEKNGYHVFGELPDFPPGHQRYFMTKAL